LTAKARRIAEACFAFARSQTKHPAERDAAIGRGEAICAKHGLDLDDFDIPGRRRSRQANAGERPPDREFGFATSADFEAWASKLRAGAARAARAARREAAFEAAAAAAGARPGETPYDARRRNFDQACAAATERDQQRDRRRRARAAVDELWLRDIAVYEVDGLWLVIDAGHALEVDDSALIDLAEKMRGAGAPA
jgi:hypothetical protein